MTTPSEILDEAGDETEACPLCPPHTQPGDCGCDRCGGFGRVPKPKAEQPSAQEPAVVTLMRDSGDPGRGPASLARWGSISNEERWSLVTYIDSLKPVPSAEVVELAARALAACVCEMAREMGDAKADVAEYDYLPDLGADGDPGKDTFRRLVRAVLSAIPQPAEARELEQGNEAARATAFCQAVVALESRYGHCEPKLKPGIRYAIAAVRHMMIGEAAAAQDAEESKGRANGDDT